MRNLRSATAFALVLVACGGNDSPPVTPLAKPEPPPAPKLAVSECGPEVPGLDKVASASLLVLGEMHGQVGPPVIAADIACRQALRTGSAVLALEVPHSEQAGIDAFLASDGGEAARAALLDGAFWKRPTQDGRSSGAMFDLLERARKWQHARVGIRVVAADRSADADKQEQREKAMADAIVALVREKKGTVTMLVGNLHARTVPGAPWDPKIRFMANLAKEEVPDLVSLDIRYGEGESWVCMGEPMECGPKATSGNAPGPKWSIELLATPDKTGFNGTYSVGLAEASEPARGLTPVQQASVLINRFRTLNKPRIIDNVPTGSSISLDKRREWCDRILPLATDHLALAGDKREADEPCAFAVVPEKSRQLVPDVKVRFDVGFFFTKPYAAASYDRESKTLFLPLSSVTQPWDEVPATRHEWLHAKHHARAKAGDALATALMSISEGPDYRPDGFYVDEVPVNLCDLVRLYEQKKMPPPRQLEMVDGYLATMKKELDAMKVPANLAKPSAETRAGVAGQRFKSGEVSRWVGGKDAKKSLALLESVHKDATTALASLKESPPNVEAAKGVPLLAKDACDPKL